MQHRDTLNGKKGVLEGIYIYIQYIYIYVKAIGFDSWRGNMWGTVPVWGCLVVFAEPQPCGGMDAIWSACKQIQ